jgi:hypothetical protein
MHQFTDLNNQNWSLVINTLALERVDAATGIYLTELLDEQLQGLSDLLRRPSRLARVLLVLVEDQLAAKNITPEQFLAGLAGDALAQATDAFIEELVDFFPDARGRAGLRMLLVKFRQVRDLALDEAETKLKNLDPTSVVRQSLGSSTNSPAKWASRRKPSRSGNST